MRLELNCCGNATHADLEQLRRFKAFLIAKAEAKSMGLSERDATRLCAIEHYGDEFCEGDGIPKDEGQGAGKDGK